MAANVATGKGAADMVEVVDEGGATVAPTGGELSLWPGVEEHAASATTSATTMTLPVLVIMPPFFLVVRFIGRSCVPSAGGGLDRLDDWCGLFVELLAGPVASRDTRPQHPEPPVRGDLVSYAILPGPQHVPCARRRNGDLAVRGGVGQVDRLAVLGRRIEIHPQPFTLQPTDLLLDHRRVAVREQPGREDHEGAGPPRPVHALDLVSLVRGTRGGGVEERNVYVVVDLHVPLGAAAGDACGQEL